MSSNGIGVKLITSTLTLTCCGVSWLVPWVVVSEDEDFLATISPKKGIIEVHTRGARSSISFISFMGKLLNLCLEHVTACDPASPVRATEHLNFDAYPIVFYLYERVVCA
jgi:hypothetical protein